MVTGELPDAEHDEQHRHERGEHVPGHPPPFEKHAVDATHRAAPRRAPGPGQCEDFVGAVRWLKSYVEPWPAYVIVTLPDPQFDCMNGLLKTRLVE